MRSTRRDDEYTEFVAARLQALRRIAHLLSGDWHYADDLMQVTITRLYVRWHKVRVMDHPEAYARTILVREPGQRPANIREVASRVRYRSNLHLPFPFRLAGIPASWQVAGAGSQVEGGRLTGYVLYLRPGGDSQGITVLVEPTYPNGCVNIGGKTQNVSFDGTAGVLRSAGQDACFASLHGMYVYVSSDQAGGALGLLHHVQVLGPDPANWTTRPLG